MRYIIADIHGCYEEYRKLLEEIAFSDEDELYVLGDAVDRGEEPIKVLQDGGEVTSRQFAALSRWEQLDVLDYLEEAAVYEILEDKGKQFILVHAGIHEFCEDKALDEYDFTDFIHWRADYDKRYFKEESVYLVTGHTPTPITRKDKKPLVYQEKGHIALDCGCIFGGNLAAYCIETGEVTYVKSCQKKNVRSEELCQKTEPISVLI